MVSGPRLAQVECWDALRAPGREESNGDCRLDAGGMGGVSMSQASERQLPPKSRRTKRFDRPVKRGEEPASRQKVKWEMSVECRMAGTIYLGAKNR